MPPELRPLLGELAETLRGELAAARAALLAGDAAAAAKAAHRLKGSCQMFKLADLARAAAQLEQAMQAGDGAEEQAGAFGALLGALEEELARQG